MDIFLRLHSGVVWFLCLFLCTIAGGSQALGAEQPSEEGWSQDLLSRLLAVPESGEATPVSDTGEALVLRSYQLRKLRLGDAGRATNLVSILRRMLPPHSHLTEDRAGNALHVLSTLTAQQAALEFIGAMDEGAAEGSTPNESPTIPPEIKNALESLASARSDRAELVNLIQESTQGAEERMKATFQKTQSQAESAVGRLIWTSVLVGSLVIAGVFAASAFFLRRAHRNTLTVAVKEAAAVAVVPAQNMESVIAVSREQHERTKELQKLMESFSIAYQADRQRNSMAMEVVARKHVELSATLEQMSHLRREMGENAGKIFLDVNREAIDQIIQHASVALESRASQVGLIAESASRKMEETANRLELQNARTEALANELERTQREVDALFEKLRAAQESAQQAHSDASEQRRIAFEKAAELARKEAALAGLSLLMQEPVSEILATVDRSSPSAARSEDVPTAPGGEQMKDPPPGEPLDDHPTHPGSEQSELPSSPDICPPTKYTFRISPAA